MRAESLPDHGQWVGSFQVMTPTTKASPMCIARPDLLQNVIGPVYATQFNTVLKILRN